MPDERLAFVEEAELMLDSGTDPAAVGAAATTALCDHWKHEGACRWPHNNEIDVAGGSATFRTLFIATSCDELEVRERIERSLQDGPGWVVRRTEPRPVSSAEEPLARRLAAAPTLPG
jgi:hypothetical protein